MPQTATAINVVDAVVEVSTNGTIWTNISGTTNKVEVAPQTADSGMAASLEGQFKIVRAGKYNPVEATVTILYTETSAEAYEILHGQKLIAGRPLYMRYTPGGYDGNYRFYTGDSNGNKAPGRITEFPYPGANSEDAGPHLVVFKLQATQFVREAAAPSPSGSVSPSALDKCLMAIQVDLSGLKIKDLALFELARTGGMTQAAIVELLDRVVVGGASELPLTQLGDVLEAVRVAMEALSNPKDVQGKA